MKIKAILTAVLILSTFSVYASEKYISVERFFAVNPHEKAKYEEFLKIVEKPGEEIIGAPVVQIALVYPAEQVSDYWRRSADVIGARLDEMGVKHNLIRMYSKPSGDERKAVRQIIKAIDLGVDYIVVSVNSPVLEKAVGTLLTEKKPRVIIQNLATPIDKWSSNPPLMYVGFDHVTGTKLLVDWFAKNTGDEGSYGVLMAGSDMVSKLRGEEFISGYSREGRLSLAGSFYTYFNSSRTQNAVRTLIENNSNIRALYSCATDISLSASEKLKEYGVKEKVLLNGWGGGVAELEALSRGGLDVTAMRINDDNGAAVAQAIAYDTTGRAKEIPLIFPGRFVLIDSETDREETEMYMREAFRYSGDAK